MTFTIERSDVYDALIFAWLVFMAAFTYIGVTHLETISKCLVIQTKLMTDQSAAQQQVPSLEQIFPAPTPDPPAEFEVPANPRRGTRI